MRLLPTLLLAFALPVGAQPSQLDRILSSKTVKVCIWPDYYGISLRNPKTQKLSGIDADLALELGKDLGVAVEFVDSSFSKLLTDVPSGVCNVAMFGVGITSARAEKLRFTRPTLASDIYAITTSGNRRIKSWSDIDKAGNVVSVVKGTLHETLLRERFRNATLSVVDTPMAREQEVQAGRADAFMTDYPYSRRMLETTDWARLISPPETFHVTQYAYAVAQGDDKWHQRMEQFVADIKRDGRLLTYAQRYKLDEIVVRN
jgi:cyclohexadienyl dehydratase